MRPSARLLIYAMWPPEAHEFETPGLERMCQTPGPWVTSVPVYNYIRHARSFYMGCIIIVMNGPAS